MNLFKSKTAKVIAGIVGLAMVLTFVAAPNGANAQTLEELQAQINLLLQQIAQLQGQTNGGSSVNFTFTRDLTLGSTGNDVMELQRFLNNKGFMVAATGAGSPGQESSYFGQLTKSALASYQASQGISPAVGYFGPITRANINSRIGESTPPPGSGNCPSGYVEVTLQPAGFRCDPVGSGTIPPGLTGDGSVTISTSALVSSGTAVKKGETRNVLSTRLKASSGGVQVNRVEVKFSERPWLTMSQVQLRDGSNNVIATKTLTGESDATEVTVGSDYRVRFENLNLIVTPGTDVDLQVAVTVLASSDKITGQTITTSIPASGIRTINGIGFSETIGPSAEFTFTLPTTGSVADIYTSISPNSPLAGFERVAAGTTQTENVVLGKYRIKAQNTGGTLNAVNFTMQNSTEVGVSQLFTNVRLQSGSFNYGATTVATTTTFTNLQVPLPLDQWVEFTLTANVAGSDVSQGVAASSTLDASTITGIDTNFNSLTVSNASDVTSADRTFLQTGVGVTNASASATNCAPEQPTSCLATFTFTLTNTGNSAAYVSKTAGVLYATTTVPASNASSTITTVQASNPTEDSGDTSDSFAIQAGASRTFTSYGNLAHSGTSGVHQLNITAIYFGDAATAGAQGTADTNAEFNLTTGLGNLKATTNF